MWLPFTIALIAILNPIGVAPLFLSYAGDHSDNVVRMLGVLVSIAVFGGMLFFLLVGPGMLKFFGIEVYSFQIAGGLLIFLRSLQMMNGTLPHIEVLEEAKRRKSTAYQKAIHHFQKTFVPVVVPIIIGPGIITTLILYAQNVTRVSEYMQLSFGALLSCLLLMLCLVVARFIERSLGTNGFQVVMRIFGLILAAVGIQFVMNGVQEALVLFGSV